MYRSSLMWWPVGSLAIFSLLLLTFCQCKWMDCTQYYAHRVNSGWLLILQLEEEKEEITKAMWRHSAFFAGSTLTQSSLLKKSWIQKRKKERAAKKQVSDSQATRQVKHGEMTQTACGEAGIGGRRFRWSNCFLHQFSLAHWHDMGQTKHILLILCECTGHHGWLALLLG